MGAHWLEPPGRSTSLALCQRRRIKREADDTSKDQAPLPWLMPWKYDYDHWIGATAPVAELDRGYSGRRFPVRCFLGSCDYAMIVLKGSRRRCPEAMSIHI